MSKIAAVLPAITSFSSALGPIGSIASAISAVQGIAGGNKQKTSSPAPVVETPFQPKKPDAMSKPIGIGMEGYDPTQERAALATKGVNTGLGKDEDAYYRNLISRSLIGDDNKITGTPESLLPVESQYFSGKGYDTSNINNLLKAIMGG